MSTIKSDEVTMYMVTHKPVDFIPSGRTPIFVGCGENTKNYITDNTGDNISDKNPNYCELTAFYWIWKNDHTSKYVSIEHYRRFFMKSKLPFIISKKGIINFLKQYDAIATRLYIWDKSVGQRYIQDHYGEDLFNAKAAIERFYPEYMDAYNKYMSNRSSVMCNMIALSKERFDQYCEWLFKILFYVEERTDLSDREDYQKRAYGFLSERLMNIWLIYNELNIKYCSIYSVKNNKYESIRYSWRDRGK